ncbi:MAG: hypothetical protein U5K33_09550 [Halofilum sp. (in: g-proteobacteria)]|nr:hypothetical protein [Halofilum sp. (in: g-proteobacteria)]
MAKLRQTPPSPPGGRARAGVRDGDHAATGHQFAEIAQRLVRVEADDLGLLVLARHADEDHAPNPLLAGPPNATLEVADTGERRDLRDDGIESRQFLCQRGMEIEWILVGDEVIRAETVLVDDHGHEQAVERVEQLRTLQALAQVHRLRRDRRACRDAWAAVRWRG